MRKAKQVYRKQSKIKKFEFGVNKHYYYGRRTTIMSASFESAVYEFRLTCDTPEKHVREEDFKKDERGHNIYRHNEADFESSYELNDNPQIFVYEYEEQTVEDKKDWVKIAEHLVSLRECVDFNYKGTMKVSHLLAPAEDLNADNLVENHGVLVKEDGEIHSLQFANKAEILQKRKELAMKKKELEREASELSTLIQGLTEQIRQKIHLLRGIEIYQGIGCDTFQLLEGTAADKEEKLHLYQETLYIDEELSIWENCWEIEGGADYNNLADFEKFIKSNYKRLMTHPLSIQCWQIRRSKKEYGDFWEDMIQNQYNFSTVIVFRNGENLYQLLPELSIGSTLFPKIGEVEKIMEDQFGSWRTRSLREFYEKRFLSLLFLQGLIDNTNLIPTMKGVNLIQGDEKLVLIRDAEKDFWVGDGRPSFHDFICKNRELITVGSRIIWLGTPYNERERNYELNRSGTYFASSPEEGEIFQVIAEADPDTKKYNVHNGDFRFSYLPPKYDWKRPSTRKRHWWFYVGESVNVDAITIEEIDYYLNNRIYRRDYLKMMPALFRARKVLLQEQREAENFKQFIKSQLDFEVEEEKLDKAIEAFKLKKYSWGEERKWKRGLLTDGENGKMALRLIKKILKKRLRNERFVFGCFMFVFDVNVSYCHSFLVAVYSTQGSRLYQAEWFGFPHE